MLDSITNFVTTNVSTIVTGTAATGVLWMLKRIPNEDIKNNVSMAFEKLGTIMTLGISKWSFTRGIWNKTIEAWFIDLVDNTVGGALEGFIKGLRSDNKK